MWRGTLRLQCWEAVVRRASPLHPRGSSPRWSERSHRPSFPGALLCSPMVSARFGSAGAVPARLYKLTPARSESGFPFSWTRFLTWALWRGSVRRAPGPGSGRRSRAARAPSLTPGTKAPLLKPCSRGPLGQAHNLRLRLPDCYLLLPQIPSETVSSKKGRARGGGH